MDPFFKELLAYSHQMNQQYIQRFLSNQDTVSENAMKLMNHVLNAQHIWNSRIVSKEATAGVWYLHNNEDLAKIDLFNYEDSVDILKKHKLSEEVEYMTSKGEVFKNTVRDILFHVVNHSTYHRAQIATDFRQTGIEAISTDYIFFKRERSLV